MKAVAYVSHYLFNQYSDVSTTQQLKAIKEYAYSRNIELLQLYQDDFRDRIHDQKPNFLRMMDDSETGKFDAVLVFERENISREDYQVKWYEDDLAVNEVRLIVVNELEHKYVEDELSFIDQLIESL